MPSQLVKALAFGLVLSGMSMAGAQDSPSRGFAFRVGMSFPVTSAARSTFGQDGLTLGLSYELSRTGTDSYGSVPSIDIDWSRAEDSGNRLDIWSLMSTVRFKPGGDEEGSSALGTYFGIGVGAVRTDVRAPGVSSEKYSLGGKAILGMRLTPAVVLEGSYLFAGSNGGFRADSLAITLGLRF